MRYEYSITLRPEAEDLYNLLEFLQQSELPLETFAAITQPDRLVQDQPLMLCKFAFDSNENFHKVVAQGQYTYYQDCPLTRPADIVDLPTGGKVSTFIKRTEDQNIRICSMISAYPAIKTDWRFAFGFRNSADRDRAATLLKPLQANECKKMLRKAENVQQKTWINARYQLSSREGYDVLLVPNEELASVVCKLDLLPIPFEEIDLVQDNRVSVMWVYHAAVTDWETARQVRIFTHICDPDDWVSRHKQSDEISQWILAKENLDFTSCYITRLMLCRDQESIPTLCHAVSLLAENGIMVESLQTIVPPRMEFEQSLTLFAMPPSE